MRQSVNCDHQFPTEKQNQFICAIGKHGGFPYMGNCINCNFRVEIKNKDENQNTNKLPLLEMAKGALSSASDWAKSGFPTASDEQLASRKAICESCEFWDKTGFAGTGKCTKCGCSTQAKLRMATSKCPIDKW